MKKTAFLTANALRLVVAILYITVTLGASGAAFATGSADFYGKYGNPIWDYNDVCVYTNGSASIDDLFGLSTKELGPGMRKTMDIRLENHSSEYYTFYLNASARTGAAARGMEGYFPGKTAADSLLNAIDVVVSFRGGDLYASEGNIYVGKLAGSPGAGMYTAGGVTLGNIAPYSFGDVRVEITISKDLGNSYKNTLCTVDWWFTATQDDTPGRPEPPEPPDPPDPGDDGDGGNGGDIPDTPPPLSDGGTTPPGGGTGDDTIDIDDDETPLGSRDDEDILVVVDPDWTLPRTGDFRKSVGPAAATLALLFILLSALVYYKMKTISMEKNQNMY
jgi:hypothetical protein